MLSDSNQKRLIAQWQITGQTLAEIRRAELAAMDDESSRRAALDLLDLADMLACDPRREHHSGLIEMQRLFSGLRERIPA